MRPVERHDRLAPPVGCAGYAAVLPLRLDHWVLLGPGQALPVGTLGLGQVFFHAIQGAPHLHVALGPGLASDQGHLVLEVGVVNVGHDAGHGSGQVTVSAQHAPGVVGAGMRRGRAGLGQVVLAQAKQIAAGAAADGQLLAGHVAEDAEEADGARDTWV